MGTNKKFNQVTANGVPGSQQDAKRRLGNFEGAGEHPRQGGREQGIVGQTKQKNSTDKAKAKK
jgi:hypothetical protein